MEAQNGQQDSTFEDKLVSLESKWNDIIAELQGKMDNLLKLSELLNVIYGKRQDAVDYFYGVCKMLAKYKIKYDQEYAARFRQYKIAGSDNVRYGTDSQIKMQIECDLSDMRLVCEILNSHIGFMKETIKNIDDIIYGINNKIRLHEMMNGLKK